MTPLHHSDFEKNVIMKNIEERKKMERELGLYNLSADMRNIDKPTSTFQERLDYFMGDDVQIERKIYVRSILCLQSKKGKPKKIVSYTWLHIHMVPQSKKGKPT